MASAPTYAIIAGSNKCGTTSLFRYLSDHPDVRPTRMKEASFWKPAPETSVEQALALYSEQFIPAKRNARVYLEGTPHYLFFGEAQAAVLRKFLPQARLVFIIRNPTQRVVSHFKAAYGQTDQPNYGLRFEQVAEIAVRHISGKGTDPRGEPLAYQLKVGHYATHLKGYARVWPREQMRIMFYEHLARDARGELKALARYLGIDDSFYDTYSFQIEHKSKSHRWEPLQNVAVRLNRKMQPLLQHNKWLKRTLHRIYYGINETSQPIVIEPQGLARLDEYFRDSVAELAEWMRENYPNQTLPPWLSERVAAPAGAPIRERA